MPKQNNEVNEVKKKISVRELMKINKKFITLSAVMVLVIVAIVYAINFSLWFKKYYTVHMSPISQMSFDDKQFIQDFDQKRRDNDWILSFIDWILKTKLAYDDNSSIRLNYNVKWDINDIERAKDEFSRMVNSSNYNFIEKRNVLNRETKSVISSLNWVSRDYDELVKKIWDYWHFHSETSWIITDNNIQRALLSVEAIKIFASLSTLSNVDSFIQSFANFVSVNTFDSSRFMNFYLSRWEWDIQRYLTHCYLNPFENDRCNAVWDFRSYYDWNPSFNPSRFIDLITHVTDEIENNDVARISVILNSMNHISNEIAFTIEINTFPFDENSLARRWIFAPHMHIAKTLIDALRWSYFIMWGDINLNNIQIVERSVNIWNVPQDIKTSNFRFTVPVQRVPEREIYDFTYDN